MRPSHLLPLLLAACLPLLGPEPSEAAEAPALAVPETRPIQLDGIPLKAEWSEALVLPMGEPGTTLRLQQFRGTLMLALESDRLWAERTTLTLLLCPEGPQAGGRGPGCVRIDYEPYDHDRQHTLMYAYGKDGTPERRHGQAVVRHNLGSHGTQLELVVGLAALGLTKDERPTLRFCAQWARPGTGSRFFPEGLDFQGKPGVEPPDFASAAQWARLEGWGDPTGPGAFPQAEWEAWTTLDHDITIHGGRAHERIRLLTEEWKKEIKQDKELVPEVIGNLEWVAQHERLTPSDLLIQATLWRYLNQHERAAGLLDALVEGGGLVQNLALRERALLRASREDFDGEAQAWKRLAAATGGPYAARYEAAATLALERKAHWTEEQAARRADEADAELPRVRLETPHGTVEIVLHAKDAPEAVKHFLELVGSGFYDGTLFHRVKGDFMAQGGDPKSRDMGCDFAGAGSSPAEIELETNERHGFWRGSVAYARSDVKRMNGSQFFILTAPRPDLGEYTVFGHVVSGMPAVDRIEQCDPLRRAVALPR